MEKEWKAYEIGELDQYLFGQGNHYEIYKKLGAHMVDDEGQEGVYFAVWAPNAKSVSVVGEFNDWDPYDKGRIYRNLHMLCTGSKRRHDV